ncbi:MAG TPA: SDR family oxidoreductase [Mycobacteriales bacterium]|nr:SDR family oxidoreductase [Mycobacteriales bacterium]
MPGLLAGKVVAVTGAGRGIGRSVALACAEAGAKVVVNDYGVSMNGEDPSSEFADAVVAEIKAAGGEAVAVADSVATMEGGQRIVDTAVNTFGRIDGVVCVAGILRERMLFNMTEEDWDPVIATHLKGTFSVFKAASVHMREQKSGALVGFTSGAGMWGSIAQANYAAAKAGIVALTRSAALGLMKYGVRANIVAPVARTRMSDNVPGGTAEMGEPEDVAPLVVYLLSDAAKDVTGQTYSIVGGRISLWNQPREIKSMFKDGRWTPEEIAEKLPASIGTDRLPMLDYIDMMAAKRAAAEKAAAESPVAQ